MRDWVIATVGVVSWVITAVGYYKCGVLRIRNEAVKNGFAEYFVCKSYLFPDAWTAKFRWLDKSEVGKIRDDI